MTGCLQNAIFSNKENGTHKLHRESRTNNKKTVDLQSKDVAVYSMQQAWFMDLFFVIL